MKKFLVHIIYFSILFSAPLFGQNKNDNQELAYSSAYESYVFKNIDRGIENPLDLLLVPDAYMTGKSSYLYKKKIKTHLIHLKEKQKQIKNENRFFRYVYFHTQSQFLKEYVPYVSLGLTLRQGIFDCVTGTSLYAFFFDQLGYDYEIVETDHHVFLMIDGEKKKYLIESTLKDGITSSNYTIKKIFKRYQKSNASEPLAGITAQPSLNNNRNGKIVGTINLKQLSALQYFNSALLKTLNNKKEEALVLLRKSQKLYFSERSVSLEKILAKK